MHIPGLLPPELIPLINRHAGVFTVAQLRHFVDSDHVIRRMTKPWRRVARGVYLTRQPTWHAAAWAGLLHAEEQHGVLGGAAASHLFGAVRDAPDRITVWADAPKTDFDVGRYRIRYRRGKRARRGSPPRTSLEESLLDMAAESDELGVIAAVSRALAQGMTTPSRLLRARDARKRLRHRDVVTQLCATDGIESVLEWMFLRDVLRPHGLPEPARQVQTEAGRVDSLYEAYGLVVELDGLRDHQDGSRDLFRDNEHVLAGRRSLRFGFDAVAFQPCRAAGQVARALAAAGWNGTPLPCPAERAA